MSKRLIGEDGYLYVCEFGEELKGDGSSISTETNTFYKITAIAASGTVLGDGAKVGGVFRSTTAKQLGNGDHVKPISIKKICFVNNITNGGTREKFDVTTQCDEVKAFRTGKKIEESGSISGYYIDDSVTLRELESQFHVFAETGAEGTVTWSKPSSKTLHFMMSRNESDVVGEKNIFKYMPIIIDSFDAPKDSSGAQTVSFNYTVDGSEGPGYIVWDTTA